MVDQDEYVKQFVQIMDSLESIYGLNSKFDDTNKRSDLTIGTLIPVINKNVHALGKAKVDSMNNLVWPHIGFLAHLMSRLRFHEQKKLNFSKFAQIDSILGVIRLLSKAKNLDVKNMNSMTVIAESLGKADFNLEFKSNYYLEYRFLRMFIIFLLHNNTNESSVLSECLLWHMEGGTVNVS